MNVVIDNTERETQETKTPPIPIHTTYKAFKPQSLMGRGLATGRQKCLFYLNRGVKHGLKMMLHG